MLPTQGYGTGGSLSSWGFPPGFGVSVVIDVIRQSKIVGIVSRFFILKMDRITKGKNERADGVSLKSHRKKHKEICFPPSAYNYGYPAFGAFQPNVVAQWLFDEASGSIIDEVAGLALIKRGNPVYGATGIYTGLNPGIQFDGAGDTAFHKDSDTPSIAIGLSDFVFEWWATLEEPNATVAIETVFNSEQDVGANRDGVFIYFRPGTAELNIDISSATTTMNTFATFPASIINDGIPHKYRITGSRAGNLEFFLDGVSYGTTSLAPMVGLSITSPYVEIGDQSPVAFSPLQSEYKGNIFEFRITVGNSTNNSGGPGGG